MTAKNQRSGLAILLADDEEIIRRTLADYLHDAGHRVECVDDGESALARVRTGVFDLVLLDVRMPRRDGLAVLKELVAEQPDLSVVLMTGHGTMELAIEALRAGAADFLAKPVKLLELDAVVAKADRLAHLRRGNRRLQETVRGAQRAASRGNTLIGDSPTMERVRTLILQVAEAECETILVTGETGTGKEVVAQAIHAAAGDADRPFVALNCAALPENLLESELFGHVRGAFTGAVGERPGCFEMAEGGSLFLDEIADLSAGAQASLLRVLETRRVRRIGAQREVPVNVRVIAATHTPLAQLVAEGRFRSDLYYRLNLFPIALPPLREHRDDVLLLAEHFLEAFAARRARPVPVLAPDVQTALLAYDYPGNARELRNLVERAAMLARNGEIRVEHLAFPVPPPTTNPGETKGTPEDEKARIVAALTAARWNRREAARALGMPYSTLRWKIVRLGIE